MNPMTNIENLKRLNERELELGITGTKTSWHEQYKDSAWVFAGGLPYDLTEGDVVCIFSQYGEIVNINMVRDKKTGKTKGFAFICYEDQRSTILAVDNFNGSKVLGRTIRVDHVENYRPPDADDEVDEITKRIREEGVAPRPMHVTDGESDKTLIKDKKQKKAKKEKKVKKEHPPDIESCSEKTRKKMKLESQSAPLYESNSPSPPTSRKPKLKEEKANPAYEKYAVHHDSANGKNSANTTTSGIEGEGHHLRSNDNLSMHQDYSNKSKGSQVPRSVSPFERRGESPELRPCSPRSMSSKMSNLISHSTNRRSRSPKRRSRSPRYQSSRLSPKRHSPKGRSQSSKEQSQLPRGQSCKQWSRSPQRPSPNKQLHRSKMSLHRRSPL